MNRMWRLVFVLVAGCYAPPFMDPLTGGDLTFGEQAEKIIEQAGVVQLEQVVHDQLQLDNGYVFTLLEHGHLNLGNGIFVGENKLLSANHVLELLDELELQVNGRHTLGEVIASGDPTESDEDWVLIETQLSESIEPCRFKPTWEVQPGYDALVVGHWAVDTSALMDTSDKGVRLVAYRDRDADLSRRAVAISGRILETPEVFRHAAGEVICVDLGPEPTRYATLSGGAVLTRGAEASEWSLAGVFKGWMQSERGERVSVFVRLPDLQ